MQQRAPRQCRGALFVVVPVYPAETFLTPCQAVGESCQRRGPLNVSLSAVQNDWVVPRSGAGYFALGGKVTKSPPGTPRAPFICPIGRLQRGCPVATEIPLGRRPPRNRCGGYPTSAVAPRAEGCFFFAGENLRSFKKGAGSSTENPSFACPFKRPSGKVGQDTRRRSDARGQNFSGCALSKPDSDRLGNSGGPARRGLACFWVLFARAKSAPGCGGRAPVDKRRRYRMNPPSAVRTCPVTKADSSRQKKATAAAMSSGLPSRPMGVSSAREQRVSSPSTSTISV